MSDDGIKAGLVIFALVVVGVLAILAVTSIPQEKLATCGSGTVAQNETKLGVFQCIAASAMGLVNSVSNSDGTLTISPTAGSVIASLDLGHANTWTAGQIMTELGLSGGNDCIDYLALNNCFIVLSAALTTINTQLDTHDVIPVTNHLYKAGSAAKAWLDVFLYGLTTEGNPTYITYGTSGGTKLFGFSNTGLQNTQGFQSIIAQPLTNPSTSTIISLPVAEPDTSYGVVCTGNFGAVLSVSGKTTTQFTVNYPAIAVGTDTVDCIVTHQ